MAEKDIAEKVLMSHADVLADCVNALIYGGERRLSAGDLRLAPTESFYQGKGRTRNQFCDRSFFRTQEGVIKAQYIMENETYLRRRLALRKASYQGGAYREQLDSKEPVYPVVSIVLDWMGKRSRIPLSLHQLIERDGVFPEEASLVDDAKLTIYHMRRLSKKVRAGFTSDMGFVVDYLNEGSLESRREQRIVHIEELCEMMRAVTGDSRFTEQVDELLERRGKGEELRMCEYLDMLEARGQERGEKIGQERGEKIGQKRGEKIGQKCGEDRLARLISNLLREKKYQEIEEVSKNRGRRQELYRRYGIL